MQENVLQNSLSEDPNEGITEQADPEKQAKREYAARKILKYIGMSKNKIDDLFSSNARPINQKIITELYKQIDESGLSEQSLTQEKIAEIANNIIGQIGRGNLFDYKNLDRKHSDYLNNANVKAFENGIKIREAALGKEIRGDFDEKIINAISHQSDKRNRSAFPAFGLRSLEVALDNTSKAGGKLFGILDSKIALGVILVLAMTIALGPAGPLAAAPLFGYLAYRVADKIGIVDGIKNIFKGSEKPLENSRKHSTEVMTDISQNQTKEVADLMKKYTEIITIESQEINPTQQQTGIAAPNQQQPVQDRVIVNDPKAIIHETNIDQDSQNRANQTQQQAAELAITAVQSSARIETMQQETLNTEKVGRQM